MSDPDDPGGRPPRASVTDEQERAVDMADDLHRLDESGRARRWQIDLRHVPGNDRLRAESEACQEHLHLF
jgi:hypothetical protein